MKKISKNQNAQIALEFTFAMICIVVLGMGMIGVFHWTGQDLSARKQAHDSALTEPSPTGPLGQVRDLFFTSTDIKGAVSSDIFGP